MPCMDIGSLQKKNSMRNSIDKNGTGCNSIKIFSILLDRPIHILVNLALAGEGSHAIAKLCACHTTPFKKYRCMRFNSVGWHVPDAVLGGKSLSEAKVVGRIYQDTRLLAQFRFYCERSGASCPVARLDL